MPVNRKDLDPLVLKAWQYRGNQFPERVRRMMPDDLDMASGAWARMVKEGYTPSSQAMRYIRLQ